MQLERLIAEGEAGQIRSLDLVSLEGGFYVVQVHREGSVQTLLDASGRPMRLSSVEHARDLLSPLPEVPFYLVQQSAYDEMCGLSEGSTAPLRVAIGLRSAWGSIS